MARPTSIQHRHSKLQNNFRLYGAGGESDSINIVARLSRLHCLERSIFLLLKN